MKIVFLILFFFSKTLIAKSGPKDNTAAVTAIEWNSKLSPVLKESISPEHLEDWWLRFCSALSKRVTHGSAVLGTGPFTQATCSVADKPGPKSDWVLTLKEENNKLVFFLSYQNIVKSKIEILADKINSDFLEQSDTVDLLGYALIDQLPFLGFVDRYAHSKIKVFLQYKTVSVINEFLPTKLIFYDLNSETIASILDSKVHLSSPVELQENQYVINSSQLKKILNKRNFVWFHNPDGIAKNSPKVQARLLQLQDRAIAAQKVKVKDESITRNYVVIRSGKQFLQQSLVQQKAWVIGLEAEYGNDTMSGFQLSYDYSPNVKAESETGRENLQWQKLDFGKLFRKPFAGLSFHVGPRVRIFDYKSNLLTVEDGVETGITNLNIKNSIHVAAQIGVEKNFGLNWVSIFYIISATPSQKGAAKGMSQLFGMHYFHPLTKAYRPNSATILLNVFGDFESLYFSKISEEDEGLTSRLYIASLFVGIGLGANW